MVGEVYQEPGHFLRMIKTSELPIRGLGIGVSMTQTLSVDKIIQRPLFSCGLFKEAVIRERRRTDRSGSAMILLTVRFDRELQSGAADVWETIRAAISKVSSEIDIVGWVEPRIEMGIILPELTVEGLGSACDSIEARVRKELSIRLDETITSNVSLRLRIYPEPQPLTEDEIPAIDPLLFPDLHSIRNMGRWFETAKRGMDILCSSCLIVILSPLLVLIALLVKLSSPGPILFRQVRIGQMMKPFMICKFRTMYANAGHGIHHDYVKWFITSSDKETGEKQTKNQIFKLTSDPRITPIGHFLRKTSLDELPQLWNVLVGEMSLVGPRPPLWYELQQYKPWHRHRVLEAKPGVTGLWQVSGRSRTTFDEMVRLDLRYARQQSLWTDIKILFATPMAVISGKGAC